MEKFMLTALAIKKKNWLKIENPYVTTSPFLNPSKGFLLLFRLRQNPRLGLHWLPKCSHPPQVLILLTALSRQSEAIPNFLTRWNSLGMSSQNNAFFLVALAVNISSALTLISFIWLEAPWEQIPVWFSHHCVIRPNMESSTEMVSVTIEWMNKWMNEYA
jgi:hypothetical protein